MESACHLHLSRAFLGSHLHDAHRFLPGLSLFASLFPVAQDHHSPSAYNTALVSLAERLFPTLCQGHLDHRSASSDPASCV